jgi:hypothetical protein
MQFEGVGPPVATAIRAAIPIGLGDNAPSGEVA